MGASKRNFRMWLLWGIGTLVLAGVVFAAVASIASGRVDPLSLKLRALILPGETTHGHHQIELACDSCHTNGFADRDAVQASCEGCHAAGLKAGQDSHPRKKFTDPANFDRLQAIDATYCVSCHVEHKPDIAHAGGLTVPTDFCVLCHADIAETRPSHAGMAFQTCTNSGCHSYHDNLSLKENFLLDHAEGGFLKDEPRVRERRLLQVLEESESYPWDDYPIQPLAAEDADHDAALADPHAEAAWLASKHAEAGVNCSACHQVGSKREPEWVAKPDHKPCATCHALEVDTFQAGLHGMRLTTELGPMTPADARLPMKGDAAHFELGCTSCHGAHDFDTRRAAAEACMSCHNDEHTLAYRDSPHHALWQAELAGTAPAGSGVSCASCHMPRIEHIGDDFSRRTLVQHNQNATLFPASKMARSVCLNCHGLGFALDALADRQLAQRNFSGRPSTAVDSIRMAVERDRQIREQRAAQSATPPPQ
ncbi:MAG: cytochrome c3 family protein [Pseudazoarcus pumilus]|nr:cytochrome c3 family protein [Pseudazoarcus pumilus]